MTVGDLKRVLENLPEDMEVRIEGQRYYHPIDEPTVVTAFITVDGDQEVYWKIGMMEQFTKSDILKFEYFHSKPKKGH
jgi:hypothetical protein